MDTVEKWEIELDNSCQCSDDDGNLLTDCYGCFDDTLTIVDEMIGQWVENIEFDPFDPAPLEFVPAPPPAPTVIGKLSPVNPLNVIFVPPGKDVR